MSSRTALKAALLAAALLAVPAPGRAEHDRHSGPAGVVARIWKAVAGETRNVDRDAMRAFETAPRQGSCAERRAAILELLPDAVRFARYARDIGERNHAAEMRSARVDSLDLGDGRSAYFEASGRRYAEVLLDPERRQAVVVFQGTRLSVRTDMTTDVLSFIGVETGYYKWAAGLVARIAREHPDMEVVATGHSLGGGLALHAVLQNPGVKGFVFNPAGLALLAWAAASDGDRARANAAITVVSTRSARHIEPVTAISLAGRSVLPGHVLVVESDVTLPALLHSAATVVATLEKVAARDADGSICDGDLGQLEH